MLQNCWVIWNFQDFYIDNWQRPGQNMCMFSVEINKCFYTQSDLCCPLFAQRVTNGKIWCIWWILLRTWFLDRFGKEAGCLRVHSQCYNEMRSAGVFMYEGGWLTSCTQTILHQGHHILYLLNFPAIDRQTELQYLHDMIVLGIVLLKNLRKT